MREYLQKLFAVASEKLTYLKEIPFVFEIPKQESYGDFSINAAMLLTKILKRNPKQIAREIIDNLPIDEKIIYKTEIAGPGFINFFFTNAFIAEVIKDIQRENDSFGKSEKYKGRKANVEFVSANPTGPLTVGHGRNAVIGDTVSNMLEWIGYKVDREYYFNNAGRQMRVLGDSVRLRYLELLGQKIEFPEEYYQGEYIKEIAISLFKDYKDSLKDEPAEGKFKERAETEIFKDITGTLNRLGIYHKIFYNENSLYNEGKIDNLLNEF